MVVNGALLRFTEDDVFPPVMRLAQSHCMTTSELCMPQFEHSLRNAWPLSTRSEHTAPGTRDKKKRTKLPGWKMRGPLKWGGGVLLGLPDHGVGRLVDADAEVEVEAGDYPVPVAAGLVDAVSREGDLVVEVPPAAAGIERRGGAVGESHHHDGGDDVLGWHLACCWNECFSGGSVCVLAVSEVVV